MHHPSTRPLSRNLLAGLILLTGLGLAPPVASAELYGLVVGVDDYLGDGNDLDGSVNDANDVAAALGTAGAKEIVKLVNAEATKERIEAAWKELVGKANPGDTIIFSYAGHGSQEEEPAARGGEADGLNENFLLGGYDVSGPATKERIVDDELFAWMQEADRKQVKAIFVADSCHSGGMSRKATALGVKFRKMATRSMTEDALQLPSPDAAKLTEDSFENVTFLAAVPEDREAPEVPIDGKQRGALSWAFSRSLEGVADKDGDRQLNELELLGFIVPAVQAKVESQQTPQVMPLKGRSVPLISLRGSKSIAVEPASPDELQLKVAVQGGDGAAIAGMPFAALVPDAAQADLIWFVDRGVIEHRVGGVVAENVDDASVKGVISKWAALKWLKQQVGAAPVSAQVKSGNQRYDVGEVVEVELKDAKYPHLTLFSLPPDGRVEFFIPDPSKPNEATRDWSAKPVEEKFRVDKPPYGAEHMVAIFSKEPLPELNAALASMQTAARAQGLRPLLEQALKGKEAQFGVLDIYTGSGG